ncbi:hypothetical protein [Bradyrhizobium liaoningense]
MLSESQSTAPTVAVRSPSVTHAVFQPMPITTGGTITPASAPPSDTPV